MTRRDTDLLVVGAGPIGLTLACGLARRGVAVQVVDRAAAPFAGSRGKGLQPRTLEVFGTLGEVLVHVRPDGYVGLVASATDGDAVSTYLAQTVAGHATTARGGT